MNKKYEYPVYNSCGGSFTIEIPDEIYEAGCTDYFEKLETMGWNKQRIGSPCFYSEDSDPCFEIIRFTKEDQGSLVFLWDHNGGIFEFYCSEERHQLELIERFSRIAKDLMSVEYMNARLYSKQEMAYEND